MRWKTNETRKIKSSQQKKRQNFFSCMFFYIYIYFFVFACMYTLCVFIYVCVCVYVWKLWERKGGKPVNSTAARRKSFVLAQASNMMSCVCVRLCVRELFLFFFLFYANSRLQVKSAKNETKVITLANYGSRITGNLSLENSQFRIGRKWA